VSEGELMEQNKDQYEEFEKKFAEFQKNKKEIDASFLEELTLSKQLTELVQIANKTKKAKEIAQKGVENCQNAIKYNYLIRNEMLYKNSVIENDLLRMCKTLQPKETKCQILFSQHSKYDYATQTNASGYAEAMAKVNQKICKDNGIPSDLAHKVDKLLNLDVHEVFANTDEAGVFILKHKPFDLRVMSDYLWMMAINPKVYWPMAPNELTDWRRT
jgi:hypothetical protein